METETFRLVSVLDDALDTKRMTVDQMVHYAKERDFEFIQPFVIPREKPAVFTCREVRGSVWKWVKAGEEEGDHFRRAFMCGLVRVANLRQWDGTVLPEWKPAGDTGVMSVMDEDSLYSRFSPHQWEEIGMVIYSRSFLGPRTKHVYRLPHTLVSFLEQKEFLPAEPSLSEQPQSSDKASSVSAEGEQPEKPAETGSEPTTSDAA